LKIRAASCAGIEVTFCRRTTSQISKTPSFPPLIKVWLSAENATAITKRSWLVNESTAPEAMSQSLIIGEESLMAPLRLSGEITAELQSPGGGVGISWITFLVMTLKYFTVPSLNLVTMVWPSSLNARTRDAPGTILLVSNVAASQTWQPLARSRLSGDQISPCPSVTPD